MAKILRNCLNVFCEQNIDCEVFLKKFLVLNTEKRAPLDVIMTDKRMNIGYENDEQKPYSEST